MTRSLDARFEPDTPLAFLNGNHALIRMMVEQMRSDAAAGLRTKAFVTGYPGSPLGSIDIAMRQARRTLDAHGITHRAAQNEEFAVSMLSGTQMLDEHPHPEVDGVVGYWYGTVELFASWSSPLRMTTAPWRLVPAKFTRQRAP